MGVRRDGMPYSQDCVDNVWNMIKTLNRNPKIADMFNDPFLDRSPDNEVCFSSSCDSTKSAITDAPNDT